jgi:hypothetical protein
MAFIGNQPTAVPLTSSQLVDGIITTDKLAADAVTSAKILDSTIVNADIASTTINLTQKVTGTLPYANGGTGLSTLGTAGQALVVNSSATALEYSTVGAQAGQVIQVVSTNKTDTFTSTATGSGTDVTGMSVNITPSSASNKIFVMCSVNIAVGGAGEADILRGLKVVKVIGGSTTNSSPVNDNSGSKNNWTVFNQRSPYDKNGVLFSTMQYLDSPSTTSQITYKLQFGTGENAQAGTIYINRTDADNYMRGASTITVMEVKG